MRQSTVIVVCVLLGGVSVSLAQEWSRFRGPNGSGVSLARTVPTSWSDNDYNWTAELPGIGHSSPVVWRDRVYVTCGDEQSGARRLVAVAVSNGAQLWAKEFPSEHHKKHALNSFASPTAVTDRQHVYTVWGTPRRTLVAAITHSGREVWRRELPPFKSGHGFGVSPMIFDDLLILPIEQQGASLWLALKCADGRQQWRVERDSKLHYATPCLFEHNDSEPLLVFVNWKYGISGVAPRTGDIRWSFNVFDQQHVESSIGSPVVVDDLVIGVCGWLGYGNEVIAIRPGSTDRRSAAGRAQGTDISERIVWRIQRGAPLCTTPLVKDRLLFLWSDNGIVTCADVRSGQVHWQKRVGGTFYASPIWVNGYLYNVSTTGRVIVLQATSEYKSISRMELGETTHATPAVAAGVMYLRSASNLYSVGGHDKVGR